MRRLIEKSYDSAATKDLERLRTCSEVELDYFYCIPGKSLEECYEMMVKSKETSDEKKGMRLKMHIYVDKNLVYKSEDTEHPFAIRVNEYFTIGYIKFCLMKHNFLHGKYPILLFKGRRLDERCTFKQSNIRDQSLILCYDDN